MGRHTNTNPGRVNDVGLEWFDRLTESPDVATSRSTYLFRRKELSTKDELIKSIDRSITEKLKEPMEAVPKVGRHRLRSQKRKQSEKTKGSQWYNLPAPEIDEKRKFDLQALKLRSVADKKIFYKRNDIGATPKYFHVGVVVSDPADFYSSRIPKKQRKTIAKEILEDNAK